MKKNRRECIERAKSAKTWGIILGTLGRQGNPKILDLLEEKMKKLGKRVVTVLLSEIFPQKLALFDDVDAWVQIACPRLSIDWGLAFAQPLLSPYEASVALQEVEWQEAVYPMDFYSNDSLGPWTPNHKVKARPKIVVEDDLAEIASKASSCNDCGCDKKEQGVVNKAC